MFSSGQNTFDYRIALTKSEYIYLLLLDVKIVYGNILEMDKYLSKYKHFKPHMRSLTFYILLIEPE